MPGYERLPTSELCGAYLRAMQEIAKTLMDNLPACDELWRILEEAEARLLEAQCEGIPVRDVFGSGGIAAYCQLIIDDHAKRIAAEEPGARFVPAAMDRSVSGKCPKRDPRGGVRYNRLKWGIRVPAALLVVACLCAAVYYIGLWQYFTGGSNYYQNEMYNFQTVLTPLEGTPVCVTVPLAPVLNETPVLYADADGFLVTLCRVGYDPEIRQTVDEVRSPADTSAPVSRVAYAWYVDLRYTVDATFMDITHVEPIIEGATAVITHPDGTAEENRASLLNSGSSPEGYEYIRVYIGMLPSDAPTDDMTVTVNIPGFRLVRYHRIGTGKR